MAALEIRDQDALSDSGVEIWNLLEQRGITHVMLLGVHVNMCVSGRPFGLRQMAKNGKHVVLVRDLTDSMYNPARWPYVDHYRGTALYIEHVERFIAPTITSDQILGGPTVPVRRRAARGQPLTRTSQPIRGRATPTDAGVRESKVGPNLPPP
jgi:hypothetical protein